MSSACNIQYIHFFYIVRRNTGQTQEKIDRVYLIMQDWCDSLTDSAAQENACQKVSDQVTAKESDAILYRLRYLFDRSDYYQQIVLMQAAPLEWGWKRLQNFFCSTSHQARHAILQRTNTSDLLKPVDGRGKKTLDSTTAEVVQDFYLDDEISRQSANTKDSRKSKTLGTVVIRYMTMSIGEAYELFKSKYPHWKIGRSKFYELRPQWVREDAPHQVCMCIQHQNIDLLLSVSNCENMSYSILICSIGC